MEESGEKKRQKMISMASSSSSTGPSSGPSSAMTSATSSSAGPSQVAQVGAINIEGAKVSGAQRSSLCGCMCDRGRWMWKGRGKRKGRPVWRRDSWSGSTV